MVSPQSLGPADVRERQLRARSCWTAQWTSSASPAPTAATKRRKSSTIAAGASGTRGNHGCSPYSATKRGSRSSSFDSQADHSRCQGSRTTVKRSQPSSRIRAARLVVREPVVGRPRVHVVDGQRRRRLGQRRALEVLRRHAGQLGQRPQHARARRLGHRQEQHALLRQDDRMRPHVGSEREHAARHARQARAREMQISRDRHDLGRAPRQTARACSIDHWCWSRDPVAAGRACSRGS